MPKNSAPKTKPATLPPTAGGSDKAPHKVWSGTLTFGLISMPVALFTAATEERISFNQLHNKCHGRIKQQIFCEGCNGVVPKTDLLRGYQTEKEKYVVISDAELEAAEPTCARTVELSEFVPARSVDALFYESAYYLSPQDGGQKPYALVREAMLRKHVVGIARIVRSGKEHMCVLRPYAHGLILQTLYWNDEVRPMAFPVLPEISEAETAIAEQLIEALIGEWDPSQYSDSYRSSVLKLIQAKSEGQEVAAPIQKSEPKAEVIDIAAALKASLAAAKARKGVA
jgi:DNA end-binding protein Ku